MEHAKDLDLVMLMYNLLECSSNFSDTTGSWWFCSKDQASIFNNNIANTNDSKSFKYKVKLLRNTVAQPAPNQANEILENATVSVPLKCLSNFSGSLEMRLINCKVKFKLRWAKHYVFFVFGNKNDNANTDSNNIIFTVKDS